jgi:dihydrofolate reductase
MGKISSNFFISLDGVVESPDQWHFPYFDESMGAEIGKGTATTGAFLMGRVLYSEWSEYWPQQSDDVPFASFINGIPKYVVSSTLHGASWSNTTVLSDLDALREVKDEVEGDLTMSGSPTLVRSLLAAGLVDELHLLVHPIVVGQGAHLFAEGATYPLRLVHHEAWPTGVLNLVYTPA